MHTMTPIRVSAASGLPYYRQIVDQLSDAIASGGAVPGEPLPSVRELSAALLVSHITVRKAYDELEALGLVVRRQGTGTFVADGVEAASRRLARTQAREALAEAVTRARLAGLEADEVRAVVESLLGGEHG